MLSLGEAKHQELKDPKAAARQPRCEQQGRGALTEAQDTMQDKLQCHLLFCPGLVLGVFYSFSFFPCPILAGILFSLSASSLSLAKVVQELAGDALWPPCNYI